VGTVSNTALAVLTYSLDFIERVGVENIQAHRQPLLQRLHRELPKLGFQPMTAAASTSPIATFAKKNVGALAPKLKRANIDIALYDHRIRISPSVYNDQSDIDKLLDTLSG
jgi:selenocysteine lyase/cysteine desulfurase